MMRWVLLAFWLAMGLLTSVYLSAVQDRAPGIIVATGTWEEANHETCHFLIGATLVALDTKGDFCGTRAHELEGETGQLIFEPD